MQLILDRSRSSQAPVLAETASEFPEYSAVCCAPRGRRGISYHRSGPDAARSDDHARAIGAGRVPLPRCSMGPFRHSPWPIASAAASDRRGPRPRNMAGASGSLRRRSRSGARCAWSFAATASGRMGDARRVEGAAATMCGAGQAERGSQKTWSRRHNPLA
jgi:hypothetical protein